MRETRHKDSTWDVSDVNGKAVSWATVQVAVLMDIRDELKKLNGLLHCPNFQAIPRKLDEIRLRLNFEIAAKPSRRRKVNR